MTKPGAAYRRAALAADAPSAVHVIVVVPPGTHRPEPLIAAIERFHPTWTCHAVWAGDPQLRPRLASSAMTWTDVVVDEVDLARADPDAVAWLVATSAALDADDLANVIVLVAGAVAVLGPLDALVAARNSVVFVPKVLDARDPSINDLISFPSLHNLAVDGEVSTSVVSFGPGAHGADSAAAWIRREVLADDPVEIGRLLDLAAMSYPSKWCADPTIGASVWRWPEADPMLIDAPFFDESRPWMLDSTLEGPPRVSMSAPERQRVLVDASAQLAGTATDLCLPGGLQIDKTVRRLLRSTPTVPARPWAEAQRFREWMHSRYWAAAWDRRPDLQGVFPHPTGVDADRFKAWAERAAFDGDAPLMVDPAVLRSGSSVVRTGSRRDGVNLVGYFKHQSGVSNVGRRLAGILDRHDVPYTTVAYERTSSPLIDPEPVCDQRLDFAASLAFINGDQFAHFHHDMPAVFGAGHTVVGLWSWELETLKDAPPTGHAYADQIWATTSFMAKPFRELDVPVHHVHIPFTEPVTSGRQRTTFEPLVETGERYVFGVVLDHLSITTRKNPIGAIRAFKHAFPTPAPGENAPLLVVKTINARLAWGEHERLLTEAAGRSDIVIWDEHLAIADHIAFIASCDVLVSLHRSEGVGLHLAEAMWLEVPLITTRYSGNLDFMDDNSALLIDAAMVHVEDGGWAYPASAKWAEPDVRHAAEAMQRCAKDPAFARSIGTAGRQKMLSMPGEAELIEQMTALLGLERR